MKKFNDCVHTSICSFGIHTCDKSITGRCHKPPRGMNQCALTKPSGITDKTKSIQLIDHTKPQAMTSEQETISYKLVINSQTANLRLMLFQ